MVRFLCGIVSRWKANIVHDEAGTATKFGGGPDLPDRVVAALARCYSETGSIPTARRYEMWRSQLLGDERPPSLTAVVPIAYPTWESARRAAGIEGTDNHHSTHGPVPKWSTEECIGLVREWLEGGGQGTIAAFTVWVDEQRMSGRRVPSTSTVRLRLRLPWSEIVAAARSGDGPA